MLIFCCLRIGTYMTEVLLVTEGLLAVRFPGLSPAPCYSMHALLAVLVGQGARDEETG